MKRIAAWILAASLALGLLAGCGKGATQPTQPSQSGGTTSPTTKPAEPQVLTFNLGTEPPQLDAGTATDEVSFDIIQQVQEGLIRLGEGGAIKKGNGQAADWDVSADGKTYTFKLKDGIKWSDGQPVTAKDFVYAWKRALDPSVGSQYNYMLLYIEGAEEFTSLDVKAADYKQKHDDAIQKVAVTAPDDKTVKVTLKSAVPYFLGLMSFPTYMPVRQDIVEKHGEKYASDPDKMVYNGPFVIKSWQHDAEIILEKNPSYWDAANVKLQTVDFKMVADSNTAINMFEAGQLDSVGIPGKFVSQYKDKPGFRQVQSTSLFYMEFNLGNPDKKYLQNQHIRKAFDLAIDRQIYADAVLKNGSQPALGLVPGTINIGGDSYRKQAGDFLSPKADKAKAQAELAAGLKDLGVDKLPKMEFLIDTGDVAKQLAQGIQAMVQDALPGVTIDIVPVDFKVRLGRMAKGDFDFVFAGWGADYDDPNTFMDLFVTDGPQNDPKWSNKAYDQLIADAGKTTDAKVRLEAFKKAEKILMDELPIVPMYIRTSNSIRQPYVKGIISFTVGPAIDLKYAYIEGKQK